MVSLEDLLTQLIKQTNQPKDKLEELVKKKQDDLMGLVSLEGAAYLVARDLGINLPHGKDRRLEIKNIVTGMRNVNVVGRVFKVTNLVQFKKKDGTDGKVVNIFVGDSTGSVRVPLWNEQTQLVVDNLVKVGDPVEVVNGMAKENIYGEIEISLGKYGSVNHAEGAELPSVRELINGTAKGSAKDGQEDTGERAGTIVDVFKGNFLFYTCPTCGGAVREGKCSQHGEVTSNPSLVLSCILDDGADNFRTVFFRNSAEKLIGTSASELAKLGAEERFKLVKDKILGKDLRIDGNMKMNKMFERMELIVNGFDEPDISSRSKELIDRIKVKIGG